MAVHDTDHCLFPDEVTLLTGRCCSQSSGKAKTSGTYNYEEPAPPWQGYPQPLQSYTRIQVRETKIQLWHFIVVILRSSRRPDSFSDFNESNTIIFILRIIKKQIPSYRLMSEAAHPIMFWLPRLPVPDMSPKPHPIPCDQRKDLALRRTGEVPLFVCVCDGGSHPEVKAVKVTGDFPWQVCCDALYVIWVDLTA